MTKFNRYAQCKPQSPAGQYSIQNNLYRRLWKIDEDDQFKDTYSEFEYLMELVSRFGNSRLPNQTSGIWVNGCFDESVSQPHTQEIDHPDILDLLEDA